MKVALIGANGQLGNDLVITVPDKINLIPLKRADIDVTIKRQVEEVITAIRPDFVLNTSAYVKVDMSEDEPDKAFLVNSVGVQNLTQACQHVGAILLHISTDYVFDGEKIKTREPYTEEDIPNPINIYGISKYAGELVVKNYLEKYYIVRVASLYGKAGASGKGGNFVYTILNKAKEGETLRVIDDIFMSPTYTYDAAQKIWEIILERKPYGIYHVTNDGFCSWYEFAVKILEYAGLETDIEPVKHTEFRTKAKRPVWSPLTSIKGLKLRAWTDALQAFINSLRLNQS